MFYVSKSILSLEVRKLGWDTNPWWVAESHLAVAFFVK